MPPRTAPSLQLGVSGHSIFDALAGADIHPCHTTNIAHTTNIMQTSARGHIFP